MNFSFTEAGLHIVATFEGPARPAFQRDRPPAYAIWQGITVSGFVVCKPDQILYFSVPEIFALFACVAYLSCVAVRTC